MKLIAQLREQLEKIGATLDEGAGYTLNCDAPSGYVWSANRCSAYPIHYATNSQTWLSKALREELPALKLGLSKVTELDELASFRHDLDDDSWGAAPDAPDSIAWPA